MVYSYDMDIDSDIRNADNSVLANA